MKQEIFLKIIIILYIITLCFWIGLWVISRYALIDESSLNSLRLFTQIPLVIIPVVGGILGLKNSIAWGGVKSKLGRISLLLGLGLISWGSGMIFWNYYIFFTNIEIPYPSLADAGYIGGLLFFVLGILSLYRVVGVNFALREKKDRVLIFIIPIVVVFMSIYLLIKVARGGVLVDSSGGYLKLFFDLLYPLGDVLMLTMTSLVYFLSRNFLGGKYKMPILILFGGFIMFYISDFLFSYTTTQGTYFNGHLVDFLFTTTMFILSISVTMISPNFLNYSHKEFKNS